MLHLKFIIAWFCSPIGLHRSVEEKFPTPHGMPLGMPSRKTKVTFLRNVVLWVRISVSTERNIPIGMQGSN
ncbi:MAG: hypothetical protein LBT48_05885 [Prevotellaceae bacterium]|jgi:hypothetical protein|nr:hypothetical protein [Prevotellaceae bacterium]